MSNPRLPAELLDDVVDHLHDTEYALRNCCVVSRSWIPRARKHLFAHINLSTAKSLRSWKEMFPDPSTSPAHYARTLVVLCFHPATPAGAELDGWIREFSRVVHLKVVGRINSLFPFHGLSPAIKSLRVTSITLPSSHVFDVILSFPLLEDLAVIIPDTSIDDGDGSNGLSTAVLSPSSPSFAGSLELSVEGGMRPIACRLLSLPGGIHFRELILAWHRKEDLVLTMALVEECSHTLESLDIACNLPCRSIQHPCPHRQLTCFCS